MKKIILLGLVSLFSIGTAAQAEPITDIRFRAKMITVKGDQARVEAGGKRYWVPKRSLASTNSSGMQEITLSPAEYEQMKLAYFQGK